MKEQPMMGRKPERTTFIRFVPIDLPCSYSWVMSGFARRVFDNGSYEVEERDTGRLYYVRPIEIASISFIGSR
jgi:hypothetical protein